MLAKDPVCGMEIEPEAVFATRNSNGQTFNFCSENCVKQFDSNLQKFSNTIEPSQRSIAGSATTGYNPSLPDPVQIELPITGLTCSTCVTTVERDLLSMPGVSEAHVNFSSSRAHVAYDPQHVKVSDLVGAVKNADYEVGAAEMRMRISPSLHCASCVGFIEETLNAVPGVLQATINPGTDIARIRYVPNQVDFEVVKVAIESTGFEVAQPVEEAESVDEETAAHQREYRSLMRKFWFAAIIAVPVMLVAYPELPWLYLPNLFVAQVSERLIRLLFILPWPA